MIDANKVMHPHFESDPAVILIPFRVNPEIRIANHIWLKLDVLAGTLKTRDWKTRDWKTRDQNAGVENAGLENAGPSNGAGKRRTGKRETT